MKNIFFYFFAISSFLFFKNSAFSQVLYDKDYKLQTEEGCNFSLNPILLKLKISGIKDEKILTYSKKKKKRVSGKIVWDGDCNEKQQINGEGILIIKTPKTERVIAKINGTFSNGLFHGQMNIEWEDKNNGEYNFKDGVLHGQKTIYKMEKEYEWPSEKLVTTIESYKDGKKHGLFAKLVDKDTLMRKNYQEEKLDGYSFEINTDYDTLEILNYKKGVYHGEVILFNKYRKARYFAAHFNDGIVSHGKIKQYFKPKKFGEKPIPVTYVGELAVDTLSYKARCMEQKFSKGSSLYNVFPNGKGKGYLNDNTIYEGDWVGGCMTGKGKKINKYGNILLEGEWLKGAYLSKNDNAKKSDGFKERLEIANRSWIPMSGGIYKGKYSGETLKNKPHGKGRIIYSFTDIHFEYNGDWKRGKFHGLGYLKIGDSSYKGEFINGQLGKGVITFANGDKFESKWTFNILYGALSMGMGSSNLGFHFEAMRPTEFYPVSHKGKLTYQNGEIKEGYWIYDYHLFGRKVNKTSKLTFISSDKKGFEEYLTAKREKYREFSKRYNQINQEAKSAYEKVKHSEVDTQTDSYTTYKIEFNDGTSGRIEYSTDLKKWFVPSLLLNIFTEKFDTKEEVLSELWQELHL